MRRPIRSCLLAATALGLSACAPNAPAAPAAPPLFERLSPAATGVAFVNELPEAADFNILNYLYYYNGGGVAAGDVDGDGLVDLYLSSNLGANRLYRNKGNFAFEDVTDRAGVRGPNGWKTGVTMADVNGDGHLDLYVSAVTYLTQRGRNVLYVNDGDGTFADRTREFGLEHAGYSTQAAFFDYDADGDLDMYLLNHSTHTERSIGGGGGGGADAARHPTAGDRLFRNEAGARFTDVSDAAGLVGGMDGYGLGVVASDLNADGCPDLYVANDFQENDLLYVNNCDGTFAEAGTRATGHTSRFSMGVDAADVDNDGLPDLFVADMLPEREDVLKTSASSETYNLFNLRLRAGYHPQYARNTLQLNRGGRGGRGGPNVPRFSEVGYLAGVHASDWSWAPLFADLDNDGRKDLFVTNGIYRRPNDLDYINYVGNDAAQAALAEAGGGVPAEGPGVLQRVLRRMPQVPLPNHAFRNDGGLAFTDAAAAWGLAEPGFSSGAAYADLDNDGALDLVVNRVNAPAAIYRSRARARTGNAYLSVRLRGAGRNTGGVGAKVIVRHDGATQFLEQMPTRGFQSSVDPRLHFGLGRSARVDSLTVVWPDRRYQVLTNVRADTAITLSQSDASGRYASHGGAARHPLFADATGRSGIDFTHAENSFLDTDREPLMPHLLSREGPAMATADVNGDGLDDVYVGGAKWQPGALYIQQRDRTFRRDDAPALAADSLHEDVDAAFFDANGDGHADLYVVSGGNEFWGEAEALRDRLYLNDGRGRFRRALGALPTFFHNGSCVAPGDYDGDGDVDLFVGSRVVSREYGRAPRSYLLRNDGGRFTDVTRAVAPALAAAGMVTSAAWADADGDGRPELAVVGEWTPVRVFAQSGGRFVDRTAESGLTGSEGWWNSVSAADLDADGRPELVLGNLGLNAYVKASAREPARLYVHDFGETGSLKQLLTFYKGGTSYPLAGRDDLVRLMPTLRSRYPSYASFGASRLEEIIPAAELRAATVLTARTFASAVAWNDGKGRYALRPLPVEAQVAPVYASLAEDFDGDGRVDLLLGGNQTGVPPMLGRYDASHGVLLRGLGGGRFAAVGADESGVAIDGEVRALQWVRHAGGTRSVLVARNNDRPLVLRPTRASAAARGATLAQARR